MASGDRSDRLQSDRSSLVRDCDMKIEVALDMSAKQRGDARTLRRPINSSGTAESRASSSKTGPTAPPTGAAHDRRAHLALRHHAARRRADAGRRLLGRRTSCGSRASWTRSASTMSRAAGPAPTRPTMRSSRARRSCGSARLCAFGMTRRSGRSAANDPGLVGAVPGEDAGDHAGRQELGPAGGRGARRQPRREPDHDRGFDPRGRAATPTR